MVKFLITLVAPPSGVLFALQKGKGHDFALAEVQSSVGEDMEFRGEFTVKEKDGSPDFYGSFVQGKAGERFIYIGSGTYAGQIASPWSRRLKIPLTGITSAMLLSQQDSEAILLKTSVPGTARDGGPNCATVKPFVGWEAVYQRQRMA